jgi:hypothetical protein
VKRLFEAADESLNMRKGAGEQVIVAKDLIEF